MLKAKLVHTKKNGKRSWGFVFTEKKKEAGRIKTITSTSYFTDDEMLKMRDIFQQIEKL
jgi:hypothetical protein